MGEVVTITNPVDFLISNKTDARTFAYKILCAAILNYVTLRMTTVLNVLTGVQSFQNSPRLTVVLNLLVSVVVLLVYAIAMRIVFKDDHPLSPFLGGQ